MFDVGFTELLLISVIALVVLGPDRLPGAIRTLGLWIGRLRRSFNNIRSEIEREVGADEVRRQLRNEAIMDKIRNTRKEVVESLHTVKQEAESVKEDLSLGGLDKEFRELTGERPRPDTETPPPPPPPIPPAQKPAAEAPEQTGAAEQAATPVPPPAPQPEPVPRATPEAVPEAAPRLHDPENK